MRLIIFSFFCSIVLMTLNAGNPFDVLKMPRTIYATPADAKQPLGSQGFTQCDSLWVPSPVETTVFANHDENNLYIRFAMEEGKNEMKYLHGREKFEITHWNNNLIEILLQPPEGRTDNFWYHLGVDCAGHVYWARDNEVSEMPGTVNSKQLDASRLRTEVKLLDNGWHVLAVIPLSETGGSSWSGEWRVNFGRTRNIDNKIANYAWNRTKGYQEYQNFGFLRFDNPQSSAEDEKRYLAALELYQESRGETIAKLKARSYEWQYAFGMGDGYRPLTAAYSAGSSYGWLENGVKTGAFDQKKVRVWNYPINSLCDHYVCNDTPGSDGQIVNHFQVDLPNGKYKVHLLSGLIISDKEKHRRCFTVSAQGKKVRDYEVGAMMYARDFFPVEVNDGKLLLAFNGATQFPDRPETVDWAGAGTLAQYFQPGWLVNAICIYPVSERKAAEKQIATDQLELLKTSPEELAKLDEVVVSEPDISYPETAEKQGFVLFSRPLGELLYPGSRPKAAELVRKLVVKAVPGEPIHIPFGLLPLRDLERVEVHSSSETLTVYEALSISWKLGGGKYGMVPWFLDDYAFCDHDMNLGETRFLWLAGQLPENAAPGVLYSELQISVSGSTSVRIPVEIEVLPIQLRKKVFHYGGDFCEGYNVPRRIYDDLILNACKKWSINTATLTLLRPENKDSYQQVASHIRFYRKMNYPTDFMIFYPIPYLAEEDIPLREKKISKLSDETMKLYLDAASWADQQMAAEKDLRLIFYCMDEAHCKGEPYWTEHIRVLKAVRERFPKLPLMASESQDSFWRSKPYVNYPRLHEMEDFSHSDLDGKFVTVYPNQLMLASADINCARFITGWLCSVTKINSVYVWQLFEQLQVNSGLQRSCWTMLVQSGIGGYRVLPRLTTVMGQIGLYDQYYYDTLSGKIDEAQKSGNPACQQAAEKISRKLAMIRREIRPSYVYYSRNGGLWPAKTFGILRRIMMDSILELDRLNTGKQ